MNNFPKVFVLGITCNGLAVVRSLGRQGIKVYAVESYTDKPGLSSKYCEFIEAPSNIIDNEVPWLEFLKELSIKEELKPVLFPTEDAYVLYISKYRDILSQYFHFNIAPQEVIDASVSKLGTYHLAVNCEIPTPWTYLIKSVEDYEKIKCKVTLPCALKPSYAHIWLKNYRPEKLIVINESSELEARLKELDELKIEVVLQELIPGNDNQVFIFPVYVKKDGKIAGYSILNKIRQQPVDFGVGAFVMSVDNEELASTAKKLLKNSGFTGMASTEYKFDSRDGKYKLIDINPRTCMIEELAVASGANLPYLYYQDMTGIDVEPKHNLIADLKWFSFESDFKSYLVYRKRGELNLFSWLTSIKGKKVYQYYAKDDIKPFFKASYNLISRVFKIVCNKRKYH